MVISRVAMVCSGIVEMGVVRAEGGRTSQDFGACCFVVNLLSGALLCDFVAILRFFCGVTGCLRWLEVPFLREECIFEKNGSCLAVATCSFRRVKAVGYTSYPKLGYVS